MLFLLVRYCKVIVLGGVFIGVVMLLVLVVIGIYNIKVLIFKLFLGVEVIIGFSNVSIMIVVVVLDMNIENIVVISINFNIMNWGWLLKGLSNMCVKLLLRLYLEVVIVRVKLFINKIIIGDEKVLKILVYFISLFKLCFVGGVWNRCSFLLDIMINLRVMIKIDVVKMGIGLSIYSKVVSKKIVNSLCWIKVRLLIGIELIGINNMLSGSKK